MSQFDNLFEGTEEEILGQDEFKGSGITKSCVVVAKITMAKQKDSGSSNSKAFVIEMETESGAKLFHDFGWYINKTGKHTDKNGKILPATAGLVRFNALINNERDLPKLDLAAIKEYDWESKSEVSVQKMIARSLIGKMVQVQVVRIKTNKQVDSGGKTPEGYAIWVDGPDEKFTNECKRFYDAMTGQTIGEKQLGKEAEKIKTDIQYCEENPVLDKFKAVAAITASQAPSTATQGFGAPAQSTQGFGAQ